MSDFALLVVDVQMAFVHRDATGANRSCPQAEQNIANLLTVFRATNRPIIHVYHDSTEPNSAFAPDASGNPVQPFAAPVGDEYIVRKKVNSAFIGTDLADRLGTLGSPRLVICGGTANHCVETTTRMAGNLGFDAIYVADGVWAYDMRAINDSVHKADDVHAMSMANLNREFASVLPTDAVLDLLDV